MSGTAGGAPRHESSSCRYGIHCFFIRAYDFNGDEVAEFGEKGIKLVPYNYRRRVWYIKCADDSLRQEWKAVFDNACYSAQPPRNKDECIATAFDEALKKLRWHYSIWYSVK